METHNQKIVLKKTNPFLVSPQEREDIAKELVRFREQLSLKQEAMLREFYGLDDFGFFPNTNRAGVN